MMDIDVVIVGGSANALGILRTLAPHTNCLVLCDNKNAPAYKSRFGVKHLIANTKTIDVITALENLSMHFKSSPVLLLSEEKTVEHVSLHRNRLLPFYRFNMPLHQQIIDLQSKIEFQKLAENYHAPIPKALAIKQSCDFFNVERLSFPCVFKPLYQDAAYSMQFKKAYKVESIEQVNNLYLQIQPVMPDMLIQEWINGQDSDIYFCLAYFDDNSKLVADFCGRKLRSWPLNIGGTASCTNAPEKHEQLSEITATFAKDIGYSGLMGMEYKFDSQRQKFYMIEPTVARTDYQHEIATLSGHNLLLQIYSHLCNEVIPQYPLKIESTIWRDEIADANALAHGGNPAEPLNAKAYCAIKRWNDPWPYISIFIWRIRKRFNV